MKMTCFKAYDVRGRLPDELNTEIVYRIGRAYAAFLKPKKVIVGRDIRLSSQELTAALVEGLIDSGVDVYDIGLAGTEMVYFATFHYKMDGGIMVTASHNPRDYNGLKFVREESRPISSDSGLLDIRQLAEEGQFVEPARKGELNSIDVMADYIQHLLSYVDRDVLQPLKLVVNAGNGGAGIALDALEPHLPFELIKVHNEPDGHFPNGIPNPLLPENRAVTVDAVLSNGAQLGIAWDGDFDRCFLFDEQGTFIDGYYIVGLLGQAFLDKEPGSKIIYDPRLTWNTEDIVNEAGGVPVMSKAGHAFMKEAMRKVDGAYGGELSAHHYFRDFAYCDSGMIPWLLVAEMLCRTGLPLSALVQARMEKFPASGEINRRLTDADQAIAAVEAHFKNDEVSTDYTDGLGMNFAKWRFNLRASNTEPVVRLNVESRGDVALMQAKTDEILQFLEAFAA